MESRVNYTAVGVFVVILTAALVAFAFWLGKYNQDERDYRRYHLYITESVSGLSPEAAVKFHGVDVGTVERIRINPLNSEEVELTLKIRKETPIKTDSTGVLKFYGITGLAFIEIAGGSKDAPLLADSGEKIPVIPSSPSLITRLDESLSNVAAKLSVALDQTGRLFSEQNVNNVADILRNLRSATARLDGYQSQIQEVLEQAAALEANATDTLDTFHEAAGSVKNSSETFNTLMRTKFAATLESLEATSQESRRLITQIEASVRRGDYDLRSIAAPTTVQLNEVLEQTRSLAGEMEETLRSLKESPSDLLFKQSSPLPGPGEH